MKEWIKELLVKQRNKMIHSRNKITLQILLRKTKIEIGEKPISVKIVRAENFYIRSEWKLEFISVNYLTDLIRFSIMRKEFWEKEQTDVALYLFF